MPGPGAFVSSKSLGRVTLLLIEYYFVQKLCRVSYSPTPGLLFLSKMETFLITSLPAPKVMPFLGPLLNPVPAWYLAGDGVFYFLQLSLCLPSSDLWLLAKTQRGGSLVKRAANIIKGGSSLWANSTYRALTRQIEDSWWSCTWPWIWKCWGNTG